MDSPEHRSIIAWNRKAWDALVEAGNRWTVPVSAGQISRARQGDWSIVLTPSKPVPAKWFPDPQVGEVKVLCLASGGGQQGPILAAAGFIVTVLDNSASQLDKDAAVAAREELDLKTVLGDMTSMPLLSDESFDLIVHPCSNCFVADVRPVWQEAFRLLRPGGSLLSGFTNPIRYIFDDELLEQGELKVVHKIPYSDLTSIDDRMKAIYAERNEPYSFGHSLQDQIGGQIDAGFKINGFYEDRYSEGDVLSDYIDSFVATRALRPPS